MGSFDKKIAKFLDIMIDTGGYNKVLEGLKNTLLIALVGLAVGIIIGTLIATVRVVPKYKRLPRVLNGIASFYVGFFRGTPMVVQLLLFYYVLLPLLGVKSSGVQVSMIVFGLNSGAYISEIMRGGIMSVDRGQMEAGRALGLSFSVSMMKIVIPQAVKNILPALCNEFVSVIKETSLASTFFIGDIMSQYKIINGFTFLIIEPLLIAGIIYFIITFVLSKGIAVLERRMKASD